MPADELIERHRGALAAFSAAVDRLVPVLEEMALAAVRDALPTAHRLEVLGEMTEDWAWTLRIQRVFDADLEDHLHEVGVDYLDLLLDVTGEDYFGTTVIPR